MTVHALKPAEPLTRCAEWYREHGPSAPYRRESASEIAGPSDGFLNLTRNTRLRSPARFEPTTKGPGDVVI